MAVIVLILFAASYHICLSVFVMTYFLACILACVLLLLNLALNTLRLRERP